MVDYHPELGELFNFPNPIVLAAGWGLIVAQGSVVIDGIEVAQDRYFKPRLTDLNGTGAGIILLVR